jgi:hypothetical protein
MTDMCPILGEKEQEGKIKFYYEPATFEWEGGKLMKEHLKIAQALRDL